MARGPNYPSISLDEAIERIEQIYRAEHNHRTTDAVVAKALNYKGLSGASRSVISALKKYGLLEPDGNGIRVSEDAVSLVMLDANDPRRRAAIRRAAFRPGLFADLYKRYGDDPNKLPSNSNLEHYLVTERKFNPKVAPQVVRTFRDTIRLVSEEAGGYTEAETVGELPVEAQVQTQPTAGQQGGEQFFRPAPAPSQQGVSAAATVLYLKPSRTSEARIELIGDVTQDAIEKIKQLLDLQKDSFPEKVEQPAVEQPAEQPAIEPPEAE